MTLDRLPDELKSGRILVATAAGDNAGLYTYPGMDDDHRIVTRAGTVTRGDGESVPPPPSGQWTWITNAAGERRVDGAESDEEEETTERPTDAPDADGDEKTATSSGLDCVDCGVGTRTLEHSHTIGWPVENLCCPCTLKRRYDCTRHDGWMAA